MNDDRAAVLICLPIDEAPIEMMVPGTMTGHCSGCGGAVWISPQGLPLLEKGARVLCVVCMGHLTEVEDITDPDGTREIVEEMLGAFTNAEWNRIKASMRLRVWGHKKEWR